MFVSCQMYGAAEINLKKLYGEILNNLISYRQNTVRWNLMFYRQNTIKLPPRHPVEAGYVDPKGICWHIPLSIYLSLYPEICLLLAALSVNNALSLSMNSDKGFECAFSL